MSTIQSARRNLWRARFFLQHAEQETQRSQLRFEEFAAYLSAFLVSGRFITDMFERSKKKGFVARHDWWGRYKDGLSQDDRAFLNFMTEQRDLEQHDEGARTQPGIALVSIHELPSNPSMYLYGGDHAFSGPPGTPPPQIGRMVQKWQRAGATRDVIEDCRRYLAMLESAVGEISRDDV